MTKVQEDAFEHDADLKHNVGAVAEYLWTSAKTHGVVKYRAQIIINGTEHANKLSSIIIIKQIR